jgi:hypothetical protein
MGLFFLGPCLHSSGWSPDEHELSDVTCEQDGAASLGKLGKGEGKLVVVVVAPTAQV